MSDKDMNFFFNFQNPFAMYNMFYTKCLMCNNFIVASPFNPYPLYCQNCFVKQCPPQAISVPKISPKPQCSPKPLLPKRTLQEGNCLEIPESVASSLLFTCDFVCHFNSLLKIPSFSLSSLWSSLSCPKLTLLLEDLLKSLSLKLAENVYRQDSDIKLSEKSSILYMGLKLFEITDIRADLPMVWPAIIGELIHLKCYKDYLKGTVLEDVKKSLSAALTLDLILELRAEEKAAMVEFLLNCFMDSKEFREFLAAKVEFHTNLTKTKNEKKARIKQIENEVMMSPNPPPELEEEKKMLAQEEEGIKRDIESVFYRTCSFGEDCEGNEYYFFDFEPWRIFVYKRKGVDEQGNWKFFEKDEKIHKLLAELKTEKHKEKKLKNAIEEIINKKIGFKTETEEITSQDRGVIVDQAKEILKNTEKTFSKYLNSSKKRWNFEADEKKWKNSLNDATSLAELIDLLLEFAGGALNPLRFQKIPKQRNIKYRKVILKLWQNCQEGYSAWESFVRACQSIEEFMLGLKVFEKVIHGYIDKKKDDSIKHDDECFKCNDGGKLLMCESCPRVAHVKCAGLNKVPIGEWLCKHCLKE